MYRWKFYLDPELRREEWSMQEEDVLFKSQIVYGSKWKIIKKLLEGRYVFVVLQVVQIGEKYKELLLYDVEEIITKSNENSRRKKQYKPKQINKITNFNQIIVNIQLDTIKKM